MAYIYAYYACTRIKWECEDDSCDHFSCMDYPYEEHGWIDRHRSSRELHENRNDVRPIVGLNEASEDLKDEVLEAIGWLEGGPELGFSETSTIYGRESYQPYDEPWHYSYAIHFVRKSYGDDGWPESEWSVPLEWLEDLK